jgi:hypothetical protein
MSDHALRHRSVELALEGCSLSSRNLSDHTRLVLLEEIIAGRNSEGLGVRAYARAVRNLFAMTKCQENWRRTRAPN